MNRMNSVKKHNSADDKEEGQINMYYAWFTLSYLGAPLIVNLMVFVISKWLSYKLFENIICFKKIGVIQ